MSFTMDFGLLAISCSLPVDPTTENYPSDPVTVGQQTNSDVSPLLGRTDENTTRRDHGGNTSHTVKEGTIDATLGKDVDPSVPNKDHGDIPTFDEWKKKMMEVEKEKSLSTHSSSTGSPVAVKKVQKNLNNYASVECGAKILSANIEAKSTSAILMENMDLYMLNPCSNKIWFVIELCEPIQVKQLDIANFELFSSTPKDFLVSISDRKWLLLHFSSCRYPTNKWRTVQSFPLDEHLYAKYVKVELVSHFGSEHFCPLSLIRVFGTSMVEEYEEIAESQYPPERLEYLDEDYDYPVGYTPLEDKSSKNLIGSATSNNFFLLVPDRLETVEPDPFPFTEKLEATLPETHIPLPSEGSQIVTLVQEEEDPSPSPIILLEGEDDGVVVDPEENQQLDVKQVESSVYCGELSSVSCIASLQEYLYWWCSSALSVQRQRWMPKSVRETETDLSVATHLLVSAPTQPVELLTPMESPTEKELIPTQSEPNGMHSPTPPAEPLEPMQLEPSQSVSIPLQSFTDPSGTQEVKTSAKEMLEQDHVNLATVPEMQEEEKREVPTTSSSSTAASNIFSAVEELIFDSDFPRHDTTVSTVKDQTTQVLTATSPTELPPATEVPAPPADADSVAGAVEDLQRSVSSKEPPEGPLLTSELRPEDSVEDILSMPSSNGQLQRTATDFYAELQNSSDLAYINGNGNLVHGSNQKESVFMRLSNRIKALEMNMSLSSRYLEELSQRYRKQMEEMQRAFNKTIIKLQNTSRIAEEQDQKQTESIQHLQNQLGNVTQLVLNLSATVYSLQKEVSDRQYYLVVCLVLCVCLWLVLCAQCCRGTIQPPSGPGDTIPQTSSYPSPKRCFSSYDDMSVRRKVPCPLVRSKSIQLPTTDGYLLPTIANGGLKCNGTGPPYALPPPLGGVDSSTFKDPSSEGSSEGSSHSEDSYFCGISACTRLCDSQVLLRTRVEKRAFKRRRSRLAEGSEHSGVLVPPRVETLPALRNLKKGGSDVSVGAFQAAAVSGPI
uniref:SUN domain-containing protein n=1 Tax=Scleropages formosus TaxID=113540 RepID=A0A8C9SVA2_SCLFO